MTFTVLSANGPSGYKLTRSLRFRQSATAYLNRTPASASNRTTWTWSAWVKRGLIDSSFHAMFANGNAVDYISFSNNNSLTVANFNFTSYNVTTTQVFRDPSAWYHIVVAMDTTQATSSNRIKVYVNGVQVTDFSTATYPSQNYSTGFNTATAQYLCYNEYNYFDGYMAEVNFVDGQALTPSSFGSTNSTTGVWQPAKYTGTYGTNGFYLPFTNTTSTTTLGYDSSGNGNNWTPNNISLTAGSTYDSMTDVPTLTSATAANYCTLNPLITSDNITFSAANLKAVVGAIGGVYRTAGSTIAVTSGKWYFEALATTPFGNAEVGVGSVTQSKSTWESDTTANANFWYINPANGNIINGTGGGVAYGSAYANGDIINCAFDMDSGKIWWGKNGTWFASGSPSAGTNPAFTNLSGFTLTPAFFGGASGVAGSTQTPNFGQQGFTYTPPSGFVALNTYNLPASTVPNGAAYMAATLYTGTGATQTITNTVGSVSFTPDFVWVKSRSTANSHLLSDIVRGSTKVLLSNDTAAEITDANYTTFVSGGFSESGNGNENNNSGKAYVAWNWKAGGTGVTNTNGTITSTVSANTTSGFSVVTWTGNSTAGATIGHGLGVAPSMVISKTRGATTNDWYTYHTSLGVNQYIVLNTTAAAGAATNYWGVSSTTVALSAGGNNVGNMVAYCFAAIKGFSAFGSYTGNGSTDGPFVYTGFRPRYVMIKRTDGGSESWFVLDTARSPYNVPTAWLAPNLSNAEGTDIFFDILSNGFKFRNTISNGSGQTFIYAAFAESPFQNSLAR